MRSFRAILSRRGWVYLLSLLVPLLDYNLVLKFSLIADQPQEVNFLQGLTLVRSDLLFNVGYALLWVGLFAFVRKGPLRWQVVGLFHLSAVVVVLITTSAYQYFLETGSTFDYNIIAYAFEKPDEVQEIVSSSVSPFVWLLLSVALL